MAKLFQLSLMALTLRAQYLHLHNYMFKYEFWWNVANRIRVFFGYSPQIRRCCKQESNLQFARIRPDLTVKRCRICGSRHFEATLDPGKIGLLGIPLR